MHVSNTHLYSPNSACTMGFWRLQKVSVGVCFPALRGSPTRTIIQKPKVFEHFQKKWCWRLSFEVPRGSFRRMLQLICLFCFQNPFWPGWPPRGPQSGLWVPKGANFGGSKSRKKKVAGLSPRGESLFI